MPVHVIISATLRKYIPGYDPEKGLDIAQGPEIVTLADLAAHLGLPLTEIKFAMQNGHYQPLDSFLQDGDRIAFFPAVGGG